MTSDAPGANMQWALRHPLCLVQGGGGVSSVLGGDRREESARCHHKQWSRGLCSEALTDLREG